MQELDRGISLSSGEAPDQDAVPLRSEAVYQSLRQMAEDHQLLARVKPFREEEVIDASHLDLVLREIAAFHARACDVPYYSGSSLGYDAKGVLWLHTQLGGKRDEGYAALSRELGRNIDSSPIEIMITSTDPKKGSIGPAVFKNFFLGEVTHVGDLIPQRPIPKST